MSSMRLGTKMGEEDGGGSGEENGVGSGEEYGGGANLDQIVGEVNASC
jgi:hypothetical protein